MKQKSVGLTLRALILALVLSLVAGTPALPPLEGVAYAQSSGSGLTATLAPDNSSVNLTWTAVTGADSYEIWRGEVVNNVADWGTSAYATVDAPTTTYTDSSVTAGTTYAYGVRSVTDGTAADWTGPYPNVAIPGGTQAPTGSPTVTVAADGNTAVTVSWTTVTGATGYQIQFWHAGLRDWELISGNQTSPYTHSGLTAGTQYYYVVRGVNAGGEGPWSDWRTDDSQVTLVATTAVPKLSTTRINRTTVQLDWTSTGDGAEYDLQRRRVHVATVGATPTTGDWARLPSALLTDTSYTDRAANYTPSTAETVMYEYRVQAIDSDGTVGAWSNVESVTVPKAGAALPRPANPRASPRSDSSIQVAWDAVPGADFYQLQWKSGDRAYSDPIRVDKPASGSPVFNHTGLSASTKYTYQVRAVDVNGNGDWSAAASATTHSTADAAMQMPRVTGLTVTDATTSNNAAERKAKLTWNAVSDATHYELQRFAPGDPSPAWGPLTANVDTSGTVSRIVAASSPSHTDTIVTGAPGKVYFYVVSAVNSGPDGETSTDTPAASGATPNADNEMGDWSEYRSVTFKDIEPGPPGIIDAYNASGSSIWVTWTQPDAVAGTTGTATSWTLQWRTDQSTTWTSISVTGPANALTSDPNVRRITYLHSDLSGSASYYYRVRAENSGGESGFTTLLQPVILGNTLTPPTGVQAVDASTSTVSRIKVSWNPVAGADGYDVQRYGAGNSSTDWGFGGSNLGSNRNADGSIDGAAWETGTSVTNAALTANTTYLYRVRTVKEGVASGWSAPVGGTTRVTSPPAPTLRAAATGETMIRLSWTEVSGATAYHLEWLEGTEVDAIFESGASRNKMRISGSHRHYVHTNLKPGTRYSYRMRAELPQGVYSDWTTDGTGTVVQQNTRPARPDLTASNVTVASVTLKWAPVAFAGDVSGAGPASAKLTASTNYQIQRRVTGGDWEDVVLSIGTGANSNKTHNAIAFGVNSGTPGCDGNNCMLIDDGVDVADDGADDGLSKNTRYSYRIRATVTTSGGPQQGTKYTSYWDYLSVTTPAE